MADVDNRLADATARLEAARQLSQDIRRRAVEASFTATPKNKMFTVTVGGQGELRNIVFRGDAYRSLAPAELARLIVDTVALARDESMSTAMAAIRELAPRTAMPLDLMRPSATLDEFVDNLLDAAGQSIPGADLDGVPRRPGSTRGTRSPRGEEET